MAWESGDGQGLDRGKGCLGFEPRVVEERRAITKAAITGCVEVGRAEGILPADIGVDVQFGTRMPFDSAEGLATADRSERSIGTSSNIGKLRRTVASDAVATKEVHASVELLVQEWYACVEAEAAAEAAIVKCAYSRKRSDRGIDAGRSGH